MESSESIVEKNRRALKLKDDEIRELKAMLLEKGDSVSPHLITKVVLLQSIINETNQPWCEKREGVRRL